jgi:hypothetical protein
MTEIFCSSKGFYFASDLISRNFKSREAFNISVYFCYEAVHCVEVFQQRMVPHDGTLSVSTWFAGVQRWVKVLTNNLSLIVIYDGVFGRPPLSLIITI